jgi:NAD(P)-dependent dehydrogenase (short-subunit alcohol dehydrogenase family)
MRLQNEVVIVTGSTTGIGKAIATLCVEEGAKVVLHGLEEDWGSEVLKDLGVNNCVLHIEDISNDGAPARLVDLAIKRFGKLTAIVNNSAIVASSNIHSTDIHFLKDCLK